MKNKVLVGSVEKGDLMAVLSYVKVDKNFQHALEVMDLDRNQPFSVQGNELIESMYSADRYLGSQKVSRTKMAEILSQSYNLPFTVVFEKADGSTRKLRGRLIDSEPLMGRVKVEDLDKPEGERMRLVDNRTLQELIVNGTRYTLK